MPDSPAARKGLGSNHSLDLIKGCQSRLKKVCQSRQEERPIMIFNYMYAVCVYLRLKLKFGRLPHWKNPKSALCNGGARQA